MSQASDKTRHYSLFECDHMRLVVQDEDGDWRHIGRKGPLEGVCEGGVYNVQAVVGGQHTVGAHV